MTAISTLEELAALPVASVVIYEGEKWSQWCAGRWRPVVPSSRFKTRPSPVPSVLDYRPDAESPLCRAAEAIQSIRQTNPMNGDSVNYTLTQVEKVLDRLAGDNGPSLAAEMEWARREDKYEEDYCRMHNMSRSNVSYVDRLEAKRIEGAVS